MPPTDTTDRTDAAFPRVRHLPPPTRPGNRKNQPPTLQLQGSPAVGAASVVPGVVLGGDLVLVLPPAASEGGGEEPGRDGARGERGAGEPEAARAEPGRHVEEPEAAAEAEEEQPRPARPPQIGRAHV